jgi:hypothetical protein
LAPTLSTVSFGVARGLERIIGGEAGSVSVDVGAGGDDFRDGSIGNVSVGVRERVDGAGGGGVDGGGDDDDGTVTGKVGSRVGIGDGIDDASIGSVGVVDESEGCCSHNSSSRDGVFGNDFTGRGGVDGATGTPVRASGAS